MKLAHGVTKALKTATDLFIFEEQGASNAGTDLERINICGEIRFTVKVGFLASRSDTDREMQLKAVLAEWGDLRDEIKRRIDQRTRITEIMISLVSALLSIAFVTGSYYLVGVIPFASAYCLYHIKATYFIHHWLTQYIRERIEGSKLRKIFPNSDELWLSWETYYKNEVSRKEKQRASRRRFYNMFQLALYLACGGILIAYVFSNFPTSMAILVSLLYSTLGLGAVWMAWMIDPYKRRP